MMNTETATQATNSNHRAPSQQAKDEVRADLNEMIDDAERSFALLQKQSSIALRSRYLAEGIANDDQATTIAMIGRELGVGVMTSMREIHLIETKGGRKPTISSQLKHALAVTKVPGFVIHFMQVDARGCVLTAWKAGMKEPARFAWTEEDSRRARLLGENSNHTKHPTQMFLARAISIAVDAVAPQATMGFPSTEVAQDEAYLERQQLTHLADLPLAGASNGRDSTPTTTTAPAVTRKTAEELEALLDDCLDARELEAFRDLYKSDRLALEKPQRDTLIARWTKLYTDLGGKIGRADAVKASAAQAASKPANDGATVGDTQASPAEKSGKKATTTRKTPEQSRTEEERAETSFSERIMKVDNVDDHGSLGVELNEFWKKASPGCRQRLLDLYKKRGDELEGADASHDVAESDGEPPEADS